MSDAALELMFFFAEVSAVGIAVCAVGIIDELFSAKEELAGHGTRLHRHCFVPNGGALMLPIKEPAIRGDPRKNTSIVIQNQRADSWT